MAAGLARRRFGLSLLAVLGRGGLPRDGVANPGFLLK